MPLFRRKPTVIEAVQLDYFSGPRPPEGVEVVPSPGADNWRYEGCRYYVTTIQGQRVEVKEGEWIATEPDGIHHYPIADDVFRTCYEPVEEQRGGEL